MTLTELKAFLRVTHTADDTLLQMLLDGAVAEAFEFCNLRTLESDVTGVMELPESRSVDVALCLLVKAKYELQDADEIAAARRVAETLLMPHRQNMGVV